MAESFPYSEKQQRWWFATHGDDPSRHPQGPVGHSMEQSRITPTEPSASQRQHIHSLVERREKEVRDGRFNRSILDEQILTETGYVSVGSEIARMQKSGIPQAYIDRWLQGFARSLNG